MLTDLFIMSLPLAIPSLYLAHRLRRAGYLGTVFNQQAALVLTASGEVTPHHQ